MPVRWLNCAMVRCRRCCVKARMTASPRASEVMKFGSPVRPSISEAGVTNLGFGATMSAFLAGDARVARFPGVAGFFDAGVVEDGMRRFRGGRGDNLIQSSINAQYFGNRPLTAASRAM